MKNRNIVIISSIDWITHWQMHHELANSFVLDGNRVLFIENTGVRTPRIKDIGRIWDRIKNWLSSEHGFRQISAGLFLYSPIFIPLPYSKIANYLNVIFISLSIKRWMNLLRFSEPVVISFLPTPLTQGIITSINPSLLIYYCANHMAGASSATEPLRIWEDKFFFSSDLVFSISDAITQRAKPFAEFIYSFPAGVDIKKFDNISSNLLCPDDIKSFKKPIIGYVGAISEVFDKTLIITLARAFHDATILLIGPSYTDVTSLKNISNIILLGERPHDMMPAYINSFDVALIPYIVNEFTDSVYSCKLNEYLAIGVPVVATGMNEIQLFEKKYPETVLIGYNHDDFIAKVAKSINDSESQSHFIKAKRVAAARDNTWEKRFTGISEVIDRHLLIKSQQEITWKESLSNYYKRSQARILGTTAIILTLYLLIFNTPLVWFAGDQLVVRHFPRRADAIVVFSGNGETSYRNDSYQRRALDAVRFYKRGYASTIYLSSGKEQDLSEVEIIKLYLEDKGVSKSAIHILDKYPTSTYDNVLMVNRELQAHGVKSILFLTAPYHGRRALWIWKKQATDLTVLTPAVVDTPSSSPQWSASIDQIRIITYEYAAIAYNWVQGRL